MKKIISVLCLVAMIASLACVSAFADEPTLSLKLVAGEVKPGDDEFTVDVVANLKSGSLSALGLTVAWDAAKIALVDRVDGTAKGTYQYSENMEVNPQSVLWVSIDQNSGDRKYTGTSPDAPRGVEYGVDYVVATLYFVPAAADAFADGDAFDITLAADEANLPADINSAAVTYEVAATASVTVTTPTTAPTDKPTQAPTDKPTQAPVDDPDDNGKGDEPAMTDAEAAAAFEAMVNALPKITASDDVAAALEAAQKAYDALSDEAKALAANGYKALNQAKADYKAAVDASKGAAQTGDMVYVVLALMVVALGTAIVVKKVTVK